MDTDQPRFGECVAARSQMLVTSALECGSGWSACCRLDRQQQAKASCTGIVLAKLNVASELDRTRAAWAAPSTVRKRREPRPVRRRSADGSRAAKPDLRWQRCPGSIYLITTAANISDVTQTSPWSAAVETSRRELGATPQTPRRLPLVGCSLICWRRVKKTNS